MKTALKFLIVVVALGHVMVAVAEQSTAGLNVHLHPRTLSVQAKAEELYMREEYRRAYGIYLNDLAPIGDKYAQYMLGFMSLSGLGAEQDTVLASAWYRLAAERGVPEEFVKICNDLLDQLDATDRARSDEIFLELRREYGDIAISMREARAAFEALQQVITGSRLGSSPTSAVTIVEPRAGGSVSSDVRIYRNQRRLQTHLDLLTSQLGMDRIEAENVTAAMLSDLDARVQEYLSQPQAP